MKKNFESIYIIILLSLLLVIYLFFTDIVVENILEYTELFIKKVFPVSFIFLILSNMLINYNIIQYLQRIIKIKSFDFYIMILSMISGFPSGAIYIKELLNNKMITGKQANKSIMFCHFPNPLFVINSVGIILNDRKIALIILFSIIISNFILFIFFHNKNTKLIDFNFKSCFSSILSDSIIKSFKVIVLIYGISVFFFLMASFLLINITNPFIYVLINGIFDLTKGVYSTTLINDIIIKSLFIILFISFSSLSIHLQIKSILMDTDINYINFIKGRVFGTLLSFFIFLFIFIFIY